VRSAALTDATVHAVRIASAPGETSFSSHQGKQGAVLSPSILFVEPHACCIIPTYMVLRTIASIALIVAIAVPLSASASSTFSSTHESSQLLLLDALAGLLRSFRDFLANQAPATVPQQVAAGGNSTVPYAASNAINNLSNVTITNANLTASEIPALNYLSLSGGSLSGNLSIGGNATTTGTAYFTGNVGIGTSTAQDALSINGSTFLPDFSAPTITTNRLYANGGSLYWSGNLIAGAATGNWASDGTNVWRTGGFAGIGTTSPFTTLSVVGNGYLTGSLTAGSMSAVAAIFSNATSTSFNTSNLTIGNLSGILKATAGAVATSLVNLASDVTGILSVGNGGTGLANVAANTVLLGNGSGALSTTTRGNLTEAGSSILTITNGSNALLGAGTTVQVKQASSTQSGFLFSGDYITFTNKLASSSLATSALVAGLVSDHTGSGSLVFGTSPTITGTPVFAGGSINYSVASTNTVPDNLPYSWTIATSSTAIPLINVDTTNGGTVSVGQANVAGSSVVVGATGQPANLIFAASSTIQGGGTGQLLTIGANNDAVNFGVNVGIGTSSPSSLLTLESALNSGTTLRLSNSDTGGHIWDFLSTGSVNAGGAGRLDILDATAGAARLSISSSGNVGIGTTTPGSIFSIAGVANWGAATTTYYSSGGINLSGGCFAVNGACITGGGGGTNYFTLSGNNLYNNSGTNIGINNTNPSYALDVSGFINTPSINGGYKIDGNTILFASSTISGVFGGQGAGASIISSATSSSITSSPFATAFGFQALGNATSSGYRSTAVGYLALKGSNAISNIGRNTAVGYAVLQVDTTGSSNTGVGSNVLSANTSGANNAALGANAMALNTTGSNNMAIGSAALNNSVTGSNNTAVGNSALASNISATSSVAVGYNAANGNSISYFNQGGTYVGYQAGFSVQTGSDYNSVFGYNAGYNITTGSNNIWIGGATSSTSVANLTTGSQNIVIGNNISLPSATASGQLDIANIIYGTGNTGTGSIVSSGNIGIGTTTPYSRLTVWGPDTASTTVFQVVNSASTTAFAVYDNGNATYAGSIFQSSDQRLKTNVQSLDASSSLSLIDRLNPVTFNWIDSDKGTTPQLGFIAQEVQKIFPDLVSTTSATSLTPDGTLTLNYVGLIAPIIAALHHIDGVISDFADHFATKELTFTRATGDEIDVNTVKAHEICVDDVCLTKDQLNALLSGAGVSADHSITTSPAAHDTQDASSTIESTSSPTNDLPVSGNTSTTSDDQAPASQTQ
jgi:hypothetical protein